MGLVALLALLGLVSSPFAMAAPALATRLAGSTRYDTAVAISQATFGPGKTLTNEVVIARGDLFPDALVASFLASLYNGPHPILLTPGDQLPPAVLDEIRRLASFRVYVVGDTSAISPTIEAQVRAIVPEVLRVGGPTRYDTAEAITGMIGETRGIAFVVSGENFPDALAVAPLAFAESIPIILTTGNGLHPAARQGIVNAHARDIIVVGGSAAVSDAVLGELHTVTGVESVDRVAGVDRLATAAAVADLAVSRFRFKTTHVNLARGDAFPDAVAAGPHGGVELAVTLFTEGVDELGGRTKSWLQAYAPTITSIHVLGDATVISDDVVAEAAAAAD